MLRIHHIHWAADSIEAHAEALSSQEAVKATTERK